jgi:hypothetical protein
MWERGILNDNEWTRWLRYMKGAFEQGTIAEIWKTVDAGKCFILPLRNSLIKN